MRAEGYGRFSFVRADDRLDRAAGWRREGVSPCPGTRPRTSPARPCSSAPCRAPHADTAAESPIHCGPVER